MTVTATLRKWSPVKLVLRARVAATEMARHFKSGAGTATTGMIEDVRPSQIETRDEGSGVPPASQSASGLEQIALELAQINARLLRAEDAANQWRRRTADKFSAANHK
ncbi:MAG TPA: hypothetical protein VII20_11350 [Roseiarcus sp.]|jgi:hypothetical protein